MREFSMQYTALRALRSAPYVIVVGNEKGGSGKTTLAMHVAIALLKAGQSVGIVDLDSNQHSLTRYVENRRIWAGYRRIDLEIPPHQHVSLAQGSRLDENEAEDLAAFQAAISGLDSACQFLVVDTPSTDNYLMRLAHLMADTLLTPLQDSFLDLGTLALADPVTHEVTRTGNYAAMVCEAQEAATARRHILRLGRDPQPLFGRPADQAQRQRTRQARGLQGSRGQRGAGCLSPVLSGGTNRL